MKNKFKLLSISVLLVLITFTTTGCGVGPKESPTAPITIKYWRTWDGPDAFADIIARYQALHPYVKIEYKKLNYSEYEDKLIEAFATDRGPDMFSIHNTWMKKYQEKGFISPMPPKITMEYHEMKGAIKKELYVEKRTKRSITLKELESRFIDGVYNDVVIKTPDEGGKTVSEKVYGLPLSVDTLALYYNRDLFNNAGITHPPKYWNKEFQQDVKKLTMQNNRGEIIQSGVALGGGKNIQRSSDILSLLMMQNGTDMQDKNGNILFNRVPEALKVRKTAPGLSALGFYTDFSNVAKEVYCWNEEKDDSLDAFAQGNLGMMFGYSYMGPQIKAKNEKLNFSIAPMLQIEDNSQINFANYWVEVASKKVKDTRKADAIWNFIQFMTTEQQAERYLEVTKKPTALKSLIESQLEDRDIEVFAAQVLTAKGWYRGVNAKGAESIMSEMIDNALLPDQDLQNVLNLGSRKVQQTVWIKDN